MQDPRPALSRDSTVSSTHSDTGRRMPAQGSSRATASLPIEFWGFDPLPVEQILHEVNQNPALLELTKRKHRQQAASSLHSAQDNRPVRSGNTTQRHQDPHRRSMRNAPAANFTTSSQKNSHQAPPSTATELLRSPPRHQHKGSSSRLGHKLNATKAAGATTSEVLALRTHQSLSIEDRERKRARVGHAAVS